MGGTCVRAHMRGCYHSIVVGGLDAGASHAESAESSQIGTALPFVLEGGLDCVQHCQELCITHNSFDAAACADIRLQARLIGGRAVVHHESGQGCRLSCRAEGIPTVRAQTLDRLTHSEMGDVCDTGWCARQPG